MSDTVLTEVDGHVLVATIDRPDVRNALDFETAAGIAAAIDQLEQDDSLRAGILTGGGGYFCAGMDLGAFQRGDVPYVAERGIFGLINKPPEKPLIAAVEGGALAGGFELMLACDMVVAGSSAQFGIPEVRRGLVAAAGALLELPRRVPPPIAAELALTGKPIGSPRAAELGLVNRVTADGDALPASLTLAHVIAANAPLAVMASKRVLAETGNWAPEERWSRQGEIVSSVLTSEDAREGARAFLETREPRWRGR
jgi:enoyl-CoA hydratase